MTSKSYDTGVILARATSKAKKLDIWSYSMSDGHTLRMADDSLKLGSWYFIEVYKDSFQVCHYVSHSPVLNAEAKELADEVSQMKMLSHKTVSMWEKLSVYDRNILASECAIGITATASAATTLTGIGTTLAAESILGALTGGVSIAIGAGLGYLSYNSYKTRLDLLKDQKTLLDSYIAKQRILSRLMVRHMPAKYMFKPCYDPAITEVVTLVKVMIKNFNFQEFLNFGNSSTQEFNLA